MQPPWQGDSSDQKAEITLAGDHPSAVPVPGYEVSMSLIGSQGERSKHNTSTKAHSYGRVQGFAS